MGVCVGSEVMVADDLVIGVFNGGNSVNTGVEVGKLIVGMPPAGLLLVGMQAPMVNDASANIINRNLHFQFTR